MAAETRYAAIISIEDHGASCGIIKVEPSGGARSPRDYIEITEEMLVERPVQVADRKVRKFEEVLRLCAEEIVFQARRAKIPQLHCVSVSSFGSFVADINRGSPIKVHILTKSRSRGDWEFDGGSISIQKSLQSFEPFKKLITDSVLSEPFSINSDVCCAAIGEFMHKANIPQRGRGGDNQPTVKGSLAFVIIGYGIGAGLVVDGRFVMDNHHPRMGHITVDVESEDRGKSTCVYHQNCLEGFASITALEERGIEIADMAKEPNHIGWYYQASYLAQLCVTLTRVVAPSSIVIGGDLRRRVFEAVGEQSGRVVYERFLNLMRAAFQEFSGEDYELYGALENDDFIRSPREDDPCYKGAMIMAARRLLPLELENVVLINGRQNQRA